MVPAWQAIGRFVRRFLSRSNMEVRYLFLEPEPWQRDRSRLTEVGAAVTELELLGELAGTFHGPLGDRDIALLLFREALADGVFVERMMSAAARPPAQAATLEDVLWLLTRRGQRAGLWPSPDSGPVDDTR